MRTHAIETPAQTAVWPRTLQPMVKTSKKVPVNSAMSLAERDGATAIAGGRIFVLRRLD
jgi:hypothetical protein